MLQKARLVASMIGGRDRPSDKKEHAGLACIQFHKRGQCRKGENCSFTHAKARCAFLDEGCQFDEAKCGFSHDPLAPVILVTCKDCGVKTTKRLCPDCATRAQQERKERDRAYQHRVNEQHQAALRREAEREAPAPRPRQKCEAMGCLTQVSWGRCRSCRENDC